MTGVGFLPMVLGIMIAATSVPTLVLARTGPRPLAATGLLVSAGGLYWLSQLTVDSSYLGGVLWPLLLLGLGIGTAVATSINTATVDTAAEDAGVASAAVNAVQQVGGSAGLALLASIASATLGEHGDLTADRAAIEGYTNAFAVAAAVHLAGAVVVALLIRLARSPSTPVTRH